jgi:hypothetical protein
MADTSSKPETSLPEDELQTDNSTDGGSEDNEGLSIKETNEGLSEKEKKGFQRLIAQKDQKLQTLEEQLKEYNSKLSEFQQRERQKKLEKMDEVTKWKTLAEENAEKAAKMELKSFVSTELSKKNLVNHPIADLILETPWAIPTVRRKLSTEPTWDETINAVKSELPSYLESLSTPDKTKETTEMETESEEEEPEGMEAERSATKTQKRVWTRSQVKEYLESAKDRQEFTKRQAIIQQALTENRIR